MRTYECGVCGWVYDESKGCPEQGVAAGTRWEDVPEDWSCPVCGAGKSEFEQLGTGSVPDGRDATVASPRQRSGTDPLVILGTGLAAFTVAREFRKIDGISPLLLVTRDGGGYYSKPSLSNALANHKTPTELQTRTAEQMASELNVEIRVHSEVTRIDSGMQQIDLANGSQLAYGRLVIAWGAEPVRLNLEGDGASSVHSVNDLDDYSRFHAALEKAKCVAVIGAGLIGCEFANDLASRKIKAFVIAPGAWALSRFLPEIAGRQFAAGLEAEGVEFCFGVSAKGVWKAGDGYRIELTDGHQIMADLVLSAIGLQPRTAFAQEAGIICRRGIVTNRLLETNIAGIYASGDCAEIAGLNLPFILPIMHQAAALAKTLTGTPTPLSYPAMPIVVKTPACPVVASPPAAGAEGDWRYETVNGGLQACYDSPQGKLLGFALLGGATVRSQALAAQLPATLA